MAEWHIYTSVNQVIIGANNGLVPNKHCNAGALIGWHISWDVGNMFNTLRLRQNGRHFSDDIFKYIFLNENVAILIKISLKFVPKGPINYIPALVQIMAWRRPGKKPLSEPMKVSLLMHICITRPQWVKWNFNQISTIFTNKNYLVKVPTTKIPAILSWAFNPRQHCI